MADNPFEVPQQLRDLAEQNVQQARQIYGQFFSAMNQAMGMWLGAMPANAATAGFKAFQERAADYAKKNADAALAVASDIAQAKDFKEVMELQSQFAQTSMRAYAEQVQDLGKMAAEAIQKVGKT